MEVSGEIEKLPPSKSISNRALVLNALSDNKSIIRNLSSSSDTQRMSELLCATKKEINAVDAGTVMRFLTAYFTVTGQSKILTGTDRMKQRPIGPLVDALKTLGGTITYQGALGFPPLNIHSFDDQQVESLNLDSAISSQYISALMMVAPLLFKGLTIRMQGKMVSRPYIDMTARLMEQFGVVCAFRDNDITIPSMAYVPTEIMVEPDWSSIGYWLAVTALAKKAELKLMGVLPYSMQGDRVIVDIMDKLGVKTVFRQEGMLLSKHDKTVDVLEWDFSDCPDLAQTVLPVCALKGVVGRFCGMENLRFKETDRVFALQTELAKVGAKLVEKSHGTFVLHPASRVSYEDAVNISTYHDHRMVMGFAPWATMMELEIENPDLVNKSYPQFWNHWGAVGFSTRNTTT